MWALNLKIMPSQCWILPELWKRRQMLIGLPHYYNSRDRSCLKWQEHLKLNQLVAVRNTSIHEVLQTVWRNLAQKNPLTPNFPANGRLLLNGSKTQANVNQIFIGTKAYSQIVSVKQKAPLSTSDNTSQNQSLSPVIENPSYFIVSEYT